ncbi:MAG: thioredoxin [Bdellovibrionaceae bacterium]|nr:thioredoxin [Pseudobdellovibrionaceae bacterium]MDW8189403.1 thioredoxin [Pseudobdellovibrionaceae bacterium]
MATLTQVVTDRDFQQKVGSGLVLVDFWAEWCGPCRAIAPKLEELAQEYEGQVTILKLNVDDNPETPARYHIRAIPTLILFKNGQPIDQVMGNVPKEQLQNMINRHRN